MILYKINKIIFEFIESLDDLTNEDLISIKSKINTLISENLERGHITSNACLVAGNILKTNPKALSEKLKEILIEDAAIENVEIAGPGFINLYLTREAFYSVVDDALLKEETFGNSNSGKDKKIQIEFVSANPTGPLHVGHGRGAAYGDACARLLSATGCKVEKEYYVNDAGRQMDILTTSVILRQINISDDDFPASAYKGDYIKNISNNFKSQSSKDATFSFDISKFSDADPEKQIDKIIDFLKTDNEDLWFAIKKYALDNVLMSIKNDLEEFNVKHDEWFFESTLGSTLNQDSDISKSINLLAEKGKTFEKDGAIWLQTTAFEDDKDRVLIRDDGRATYFASDVAYHKNKLDRGFDKIINIWGADHHGYIKRIEASLASMNFDKNKLQVCLVQFANLFQGGSKVKMSTRSGEFFTLADLIENIGVDASRFYYLSKQADQHLDFDLDLAKSDKKENIYYYIQYAHARIESLNEKFINMSIGSSKNTIKNGEYKNCDKIIHELMRYPEIVQRAADNMHPHIIIYYLRDLAHTFHSFYNDNHVLSESEDNLSSIMSALNALKIVFGNALNLLGISPLNKM